jgi:hypothetical protein
MNNEITYRSDSSNEQTEKTKTKLTQKRLSGTPSEGTIAKMIGAGDNAKNSIVWITIRWSFIIGSITSLAIYLRPAYCQAELQGNLLEDIKSAWGVFMPIITLALGYIFGKGR